MKLNFNFDGKTFLSKWWKIVRDNFTAIQTDHNTLSNKLDTEITQRTNADVGLANQITAEKTARESADSSLSSRINNEATIRQAADNELQRNIDSEITERQTADTNISNSVKAEESAFQLTRSVGSVTLHIVYVKSHHHNRADILLKITLKSDIFYIICIIFSANLHIKPISLHVRSQNQTALRIICFLCTYMLHSPLPIITQIIESKAILFFINNFHKSIF